MSIHPSIDTHISEYIIIIIIYIYIMLKVVCATKDKKTFSKNRNY
jgi:hypothetical protein